MSAAQATPLPSSSPSTSYSSDEFTSTWQQVVNVHRANDEIIDRLNRTQGTLTTHTLYPEFYESEDKLLTLEVVDHQVPRLDLIKNWVPKVVPAFDQTKMMNMFNDKVDYSLHSFADLVRLNKTIYASAEKFGLLDTNKSPPILKLFLSNLRIVRHLLDEIDDRVKSQSEEVQKLKDRAVALRAELTAWKSDALAWNLRNSAPAPTNTTFNPSYRIGDLTISTGGRTIHKLTPGHACISSANHNWRVVTLEMRAQLPGDGWVFVGVTYSPNSLQKESFRNYDVIGWAFSADGTNTKAYKKNRGDKTCKVWTVGTRLKLFLFGNRLRIRGDGWMEEKPLVASRTWYLHINTHGASVKIVKDLQ